MFDIFNQDAFSMASMTDALDHVEHTPSHIKSLGVFEPNPIRSEKVAIEKREGKLELIQTSQRGAPLPFKSREKRTIRDLRTVRLAKKATIHASELQFIRDLGAENATVAVQQEIVRRLDGPSGLVAELNMTKEHMMLAAVQGLLLDADGSELYNFYNEFDVPGGVPTPLHFDLANKKDGDLRAFIQSNVIRPLRRKSMGAPITQAHFLCGDQFWDDLLKNPEFRESWAIQQAGAELRKDYDMETVNFAGGVFQNYVGSDDNMKVAIPDDDCIIIPRAPGIFQEAMAPGESFEHVGGLGKPMYAMVIPDYERNQKVDIEVYSYPLIYCRRPDLLMRGTLAA